MTDKDMVVNLYNMPEEAEADPRPALAEKGILLKRALPCDRTEIREFIEREFSVGWADEAERALYNTPPALLIAVKNEKVVGFCAYDSTALGYVGPLGVSSSERRQGLGEALIASSLKAMREKGYGYAIINAGPVDYYRRKLNAVVIGDHIGVYTNMISPPKHESEEE